MKNFEPYSAYLRLCKPPKIVLNSQGNVDPKQVMERQKKGITAQNLADFLKENGFEVSYTSLKSVIMIFDSSLEGKLDFEDFLKMVLSQDSPDLRFYTVSNPNYEVSEEENLGEELEYTLAKFFWKLTSFLDRIASDKEIILTLSNQNLIYKHSHQQYSA